MKALWENSLTRVLRDAQWLRHLASGGKGLPIDTLQLLEGGAEMLCGDAWFSSNSRFFVFELKGSERSISSEWNGPEGLPKAIFAHLKQVVVRANKANGVADILEDDRETIELSLRGHHFLYASEVGAGVTRIDCWVEPYLLATARRSKSSHLCMEPLVASHTLTTVVEGLAWCFKRLSLSDVMDNPCQVVLDTSTDGSFETATSIGPIGLTPEELARYLWYLAEADDGGGEEVRAVVMDDSGNFFGVVSQLSDFLPLSAFLANPAAYAGGPTPKSRPTIETKIR